MKIYINDKKIDFTLNKEDTLETVFHGLEKWGEENELLLNECLIDGKNFYDIPSPDINLFSISNTADATTDSATSPSPERFLSTSCFTISI